MKLFRNIEPGINPDLELRRFLTERTSFGKLSPVHGSIEYQSGDDFSVGIMQGSLDSEQTAWTLFKDFCGSYLAGTAGQEPQSIVASQGWTVSSPAPPDPQDPALQTALAHASSLGFTTAELHQALASHTEEPDLRPDQFTAHYQRSLYQSLRAAVRQELSAIRNRAHGNYPSVT